MNPKISNTAMASAATEYSHAVNRKADKILFRLRSGSAACKLAYVSGESATNYITIPAGATKTLDARGNAALTLYFQSPTATQVAEIEEWIM